MWLSVVPLIYGIASPKAALFRKELNFGRNFLTTALGKLVVFGVVASSLCQPAIWRALGRPAERLAPLVLSAATMAHERIRNRLSLGTGEKRS